MKKLISVFVFLIVIIGVTKAQDKIVTTAGDTINCRIVKISDTKIQYEQKNKEGQFVGRFISTEQVREFYQNSAIQTEQYVDYQLEDIKFSKTNSQQLYLGAGFGFDYGGFGGKIEYLPIKEFGIFGGLGYNLLGLGWVVKKMIFLEKSFVLF